MKAKPTSAQQLLPPFRSINSVGA
jgi:hypothetical protein